MDLKHGSSLQVHQQMNTETVAHIHHGILYRNKRNKIMTSIGKWMPLETIMLNKINQTTNTTISLICVVYIHKFKMHVYIHMCVYRSQNYEGDDERRGKDLRGGGRYSYGVCITQGQKGALTGRREND